jgi:two-component system, cell cycle response regulator CpdR
MGSITAWLGYRMNDAQILLVDDDQDVLEMADCFFKKAGLEIHCAEDGEMALEKIRRRNFAVIITDFNMPGMNGLELAEKVRGITPSAKIIMATGQPSQELSDLAIQAGIKTVLPKPLHMAQLLTLVNEMIEFTFS